MAQREGNAVLPLFVAALILIAGLVVVVYILGTAKKQLEDDLAVLQEEKARVEKTSRERFDQLKALRTLVAGSHEGWTTNEFLANKLKEVEEQISELDKQLGTGLNPTYVALIDPYDHFDALLKEMKRALDAQKETAKTALVNYENLRSTTEEQLKELDTKNQELKQQLSELESRYEDNDRSLRQSIEKLTNQIAEKEDECTAMELRYKKEIAFRQNSIQQLQVRLDKLQEELRQQKTIEDIEPDGQILEVESKSRLVWVNLGRRNHLRPGLVFRVFQYVGGKKRWKGSIEIRRVEDRYSEGRILSEEDSLDPIAVNDQVTSPFYDPEEAPVFVFAGDRVSNPAYPLSFIKRRLERFGARIADEVKIDTDFLVALENYEQTPEYTTARELGVTILRESDIIEYLGR